MSVLSHIPFSQKTLEVNTSVEEAASARMPVKARAIRPKGILSLMFGSSGFKTVNRADFEESPYDFKRIAKAIDTDSYAKQAFGKYKDLFWKEGWTITGENQQAVDYVWSRLNVMEELMGRSIDDFLTEVVAQLVQYGNVFIAKARTDISSMIPELKRLPDSERSKVIAGLYVIPTEAVRIKRNKFNKTLAYAQVLNETNYTMGGGNKESEVIWKADDVIHLFTDRKPGRAFGTPFIEPALDDIVSLRQVEEDILNLINRELHPLYVYKVGTENLPAKEGEIDEALAAIENLKAEGGLVAPGNHNVEVIGAQDTALNIDEYLKHFKERVAIGLGVSPHHLGMMGTSSNRSVTERLDLALYDKIKNLQYYFENAVRLHIINPILQEGGFKPTGASNNNSEDACYFDFNEIDIDTQIKKENHYMDLFLKSGMTFTELRDKLKLSPDVDPLELMMVMQAQLAAASQQQVSEPDPNRPDAKTPVGKGQINLPNLQRGTSTKNRPINQYGRNQSPNIKNQLDSADAFKESIMDFIEDGN